jgi:23S rRNA (guanosine2251-2'-O)-methyltransferase
MNKKIPKKALENQHEILFGFHSVGEALKANRRKIYKVFIADNRTAGRGTKIEFLAEKYEIPIEIIAPGKLDQLSGFSNHQGIAAQTGAIPFFKAEKVIGLAQKKQTPSFILVLENIEDPHNMGALIRTALCSGVDYILIPKNRSAHPSPAVSRSSAGAMEHARMFMMTNTASTLRALKDTGFWISGLDANGSTPLFDADLKNDIVLVIGGEHKGIRPVVKRECDFLLSIPNKGRINSLNASVAGGMAMYEALRQRG